MRKYPVPDFLLDVIDQAVYERWLQGRANAHVRRDRKRGNETATIASYKLAIHDAVIASKGHDHYTGESLDWSLVGVYDNAASRSQKRAYEKSFALLPTVDHVGDGLGAADFCLCAWRTNDCK